MRWPAKLPSGRWRVASTGKCHRRNGSSSTCRSSIPKSLPDQERCCALFAAAGDADLLKWAELHADIIRRFGRFPHRNAVLGRATTPEEQAFLDGDGFKG